MKLRVRAAAFVVAALAVFPAAHGDSPRALTYHALRESNLPTRADPFPIWYSPTAEREMEDFATTMGRAVAWYRDLVDWDGPLRLAVLDAEDYERFAAQPFPVPYAEVDTGLVVMPNSIATFPGFDAWGFEDRSLNNTLTLHEIGHAIARDIGLWSNSFWVNELIANVFLAGYLRASGSADRTLLNGVPPGFDAAGRTVSLRILDDIYSGVGLDNYAWFQFRLAAIADALADTDDFGALVTQLLAAFPAGEVDDGSVRPTPEEAFRRLEKIRPGISAMARDMLVPLPMETVQVRGCKNAPASTGNNGYLEIENATAAPLAINDRESVRWMVRLDLETDPSAEGYEAEVDRATDAAMETDEHAIVVPPNHRRVMTRPAGTEFRIVGLGCVTVAEVPARFVAN